VHFSNLTLVGAEAVIDWCDKALLRASGTCPHRDDGRGRCIECGAFL
jgi:hypothetical protein